MKIDGKIIALEIKKSLLLEVNKLHKKHIIPQLAIVYCNTDDSILAYIRQKQKFGLELDIKVTPVQINKSASRQSILNRLGILNKDHKVHGIIIQRPFLISISENILKNLVNPQKDVDGFHPKSCCEAPIALSVNKILEYVYTYLPERSLSAPFCAGRQTGLLRAGRDDHNAFQTGYKTWLSEKKILVIGRGEAGGAPLAQYFQKYGISFLQAHSETKNIDGAIAKCDIIISCVGKPNIVRHDIVKSDAILIGIGLYREKGRLQTDYNQEKIAPHVAFYTPAPGGVGPINVSYLFYNLISVINLSSSN